MEQECGDREKDERAVAEAEAEVRSEAAEALLPKRNRATADAKADNVRRSSGNTIRESSEETAEASFLLCSPYPGRVSVIT